MFNIYLWYLIYISKKCNYQVIWIKPNAVGCISSTGVHQHQLQQQLALLQRSFPPVSFPVTYWHCVSLNFAICTTSIPQAIKEKRFCCCLKVLFPFLFDRNYTANPLSGAQRTVSKGFQFQYDISWEIQQDCIDFILRLSA